MIKKAMILHRLLDHDLHRTRQNIQAIPLWIETPARPQFVPAIISGSAMDIPEKRFLVSRKLTQDGKLRSGVFKYNPDLIDDVIGDLIQAAYDLSVKENWPNVFRGKGCVGKAFDYVQNLGGMKSQPHMCLIPEGPFSVPFTKAAGKDLKDSVYRGVCSTTPCKVSMPVFCSRPDFVGMYTQFVGGRSSIVLHNVRNGLSFCPPDRN